jgi:hypothetical protein
MDTCTEHYIQLFVHCQLFVPCALQTPIGAYRGRVGLTNQISPAHRVQSVLRDSRSAQPLRLTKHTVRPFVMHQIELPKKELINQKLLYVSLDHVLVSGTFGLAPVGQGHLVLGNHFLNNDLALELPFHQVKLGVAQILLADATVYYTITQFRGQGDHVVLEEGQFTLVPKVIGVLIGASCLERIAHFVEKSLIPFAI